MFFSRFLTGSLWNGCFICALLVLKKILGNRVSLRFHYDCWYILIGSLLFPFLPGGIWNGWLKIPSFSHRSISAYSIPAHRDTILPGAQWLQDSVQLKQAQNAGSWLYFLAFAIWLTGVFILIAYYWCGSYRLRQIKQFARTPSQRVLHMFHGCCQRLCINKKNIQIRQSRFISVPISFGWKTPLIVLPTDRTDALTKSELEHILLHELTHIQHRDWITNYFVCWIQALYWFHPLVWFAFRQMRKDREAYCDWAVLHVLGDEPERIAYGHTLLNFSAGKKPKFHTANGLCQNKEQLKYRLEHIVDFRLETKGRKVLGRCVSLALVISCMLQIPFMAFCTETSGEYYRPSRAISVQDGGWEDLFAGYHGCAVVYDLSADRYRVYNESEITRRVPPCSTFKIYSALNALEQGIITPESSTLSWNGRSNEFASWDDDHDLTSAMHRSVNWYFQALDQAAGIQELSRFYGSIGYGNGQVGRDPASYWNGSALKISALEQVDLLVKLYRNEFDFHEKNIRAVTDSLRLADTGSCQLYGKTGTGSVDHTNVAGWFAGYVETQGNTWFFAVYLWADSGADGAAAVAVTTEILKRLELEISVPL